MLLHLSIYAVVECNCSEIMYSRHGCYIHMSWAINMCALSWFVGVRFES